MIPSLVLPRAGSTGIISGFQKLISQSSIATEWNLQRSFKQDCDVLISNSIRFENHPHNNLNLVRNTTSVKSFQFSSMVISTLRFSRLPASIELSPTGLRDPKPREIIPVSSRTFIESRKSATALARSSESV